MPNTPRPRQVRPTRESGLRRCPAVDHHGARCGSYLTSDTDDRGTQWICDSCHATSWFACELCDAVVRNGCLRLVETTLARGKAWCCDECQDSEAEALFRMRSSQWLRANAEDIAARRELPFGGSGR
jgi:hypothetical protein